MEDKDRGPPIIYPLVQDLPKIRPKREDNAGDQNAQPHPWMISSYPSLCDNTVLFNGINNYLEQHNRAPPIPAVAATQQTQTSTNPPAKPSPTQQPPNSSPNLYTEAVFQLRPDNNSKPNRTPHPSPFVHDVVGCPLKCSRKGFNSASTLRKHLDTEHINHEDALQTLDHLEAKYGLPRYATSSNNKAINPPDKAAKVTKPAPKKKAPSFDPARTLAAAAPHKEVRSMCAACSEEPALNDALRCNRCTVQFAAFMEKRYGGRKG